MSHACCIVALSPDDLQRAGGDVKEAISYQMHPFDENGEWFKEGSRWDWWVIGGRYTGKFALPEILRIGMRIVVKFSGCREVGNTILRKDINLEALTKKAEIRTRKMWEEYQKDTKKGWLYGIEEGDTEESLVANAITKPLTAYTFLRNRCWNECERLGWFGSGAKTECEIKAERGGKEYVGRCICEKEGAKIITWSGPKDSEDLWDKMYYRRFIQELPDDTLLVVVDYHV